MSHVATKHILKEMSEAFAKKSSDSDALSVNIQVDTTEDEPFQWHVICSDNEIHYGPGFSESAVTTFSLDQGTLQKLYDGTWNGLTAAGRAHVNDPAPLNFTMPRDRDPLSFMREGYFFVTHFFNTSIPTRLKFGPGHTRTIHGAGACALFYTEGLRSAYYCVSGNEVLNADGAKDPMHQAFIVIGGQGAATIGEETVSVSRGDVLYIPPNTIHMLKADEGDSVEMIWLAWGDKA